MSDDLSVEEGNAATNQSAEVEAAPVSRDSGEEQTPERPDWLPNKFETPEQLAVSYAELEKSYHTRRDDLKSDVMDEMVAEHNANVPAAPGDYSMDIQFQGETVTVPETPMTGWFRDKAHELGMAQDQFDSIVGEYMQMEAMSGPAWDDEAQQLGEFAEKRLERVDAWAGAHLSEEAYGAFAQIPATASTIKLYEELMELNGQPQFNMVDSNSFQEELSESDLKSMMNDPRYWREKDDAFINKVRAGFRQVALRKHGTLEQAM